MATYDPGVTSDILQEDGFQEHNSYQEDVTSESNSDITNQDMNTENDICEYAFLEGPGQCSIKDCSKLHNLNFTKIRRGACFKEFYSPGSCPRKSQCRFTHEIPDILRHDQWVCGEVERQFKQAEKKRKEREEQENSRRNSRDSRSSVSSGENRWPKVSGRLPSGRENSNQRNEEHDRKHVPANQQSATPSVRAVEPEYVVPFEQQYFLQLIRSMIQQQIPQFLSPFQQPQNVNQAYQFPQSM